MKRLLFFVMLLTVVALTACNSNTLAPPAGGDAPVAGGGNCPEATADTLLLENETYGYCLLFPTGYVTEGTAQATMIDPAPGTAGRVPPVPQLPFVEINVEPAAGRTAADVADLIFSEFQDFGIPRSDTTIGGEPAIVLDRMPGQELGRVVLLTHGDLLYTLRFAPADDTMGDVFTQMETLYGTITNTFAFTS